jgi:hypothetical protein
MLATEEHKKSQRGALDFGIAGLNSRESRAQRGNPVKSIVKLAVFVNFSDVASFEGRSAIGKGIAGTLVKCLFG